MHWVISLLVCLVASASVLAQPNPHVAPTPPRSPEDERKLLHVPPGFEVQLVAAEPDIQKPLNIHFDARGRLWVTCTVEYPFPVKEGTKGRDTIRILEDKDGDGKADRITIFADGLNIPIGVLPITGGAIAHSIPNVYRFDDTDGDDRADRKEILFSGYGFRDTHGLTGEFTWGFDGRVYACHGFANSSTVKAPDGTVLRMHSGNTYRFFPDGSKLEQYTWGQVNPFGLAFDPLGNLFSCDCHSRPIYQLLRGGYYPSFGKPHDGLGFAPEMMTHNHGSTAIAGIAYYAAQHFPPKYRDGIFIGNVVTNRINWDRLERHGSTLKAIAQPDFLRSDDPWFRPVDIKLGPDGALYVADFYNRIIGHYEVPLTHPGRDRERGRIWRIVYRGQNRSAEIPSSTRTDFSRASVQKLLEALQHPNLTVRVLATNQLVERGGDQAVSAIQKFFQAKSTPTQRAHGLWILERTHSLEDRLLEQAASDTSPIVRIHAMRVMSERSTWSKRLYEVVVRSLNDQDAFVQRGAADALGTHPRPENIRPLLDLLPRVPPTDSHLRYTVRQALRNQLLTPDHWKRLPLGAERDRRAIADVAPAIPSLEAARFLARHLTSIAEPHTNQLRYIQHAARYGDEQVSGRIFEFIRQQNTSPSSKLGLFKAYHQGLQAKGRTMSEDARKWAAELVQQLLNSKTEKEVLGGFEAAALLRAKEFATPIERMLDKRPISPARHKSALSALSAIDPKGSINRLARAVKDASLALEVREHAAELLAASGQVEAQQELIQALVSAPAPLQNSIAFGLAGTRAGAERLLKAVAEGKASARLLQLRRVEVRLQNAGVPDLKARLAELTRGLPAPDQRMLALLTERRRRFASATPDPKRGFKVFEKNCAVCHRLANKGAKIGPELDGVGTRGLDRLLEDILDPNRNIDQAFRTTTLALKNGQLISGLLLRTEGEVFVLADAKGSEVRVEKNMVDERAVAPISPMPANFDEQIKEEEFFDLIAFLLTQRTAKRE
ncbi:MAG: hypothetical protein KatS3mg105_4257 [Gemmatales bacterium]|nr:MAG: hypothetical protein KatS3mg105_4257 [Gemmatales bacterium]